jgi:hypothetical protein
MKAMDDRRRFMTYLAGLPLSSVLFPDASWAQAAAQGSPRITKEMLVYAAAVAGESLTDSELDAMLERVNQNLPIYADLQALTLDNGVMPPLYFNPVLPGMAIDRTPRRARRSRRRALNRPRTAEELAYLPVTDLAELIRTRRITPLELTEIW